LVMMCGGFYLLLNSISVTSGFHLGMRLYGFGSGGFSITSGMIMIPFMIGIGIIFYNAKNILGWILTIGSLVALIFGVIASVRFTFHQMSAFDLIMILVLSVGGAGLFLRALKSA
jgi:hypothetical protein